ncbi:MAG: hypothetical protein K8M05_26350, partial [Deltaproteobacteria bacterium]|nr:hypothetical protein [Kofleriaceae bacterium]
MALAAVVLASVAAGDAAAYPRFQLATGVTRCQDCHLSPGGDGREHDGGEGHQSHRAPSAIQRSTSSISTSGSPE